MTNFDALDKALAALQQRGLDPESPGGAVALQFLLQGAGPSADVAQQPEMERANHSRAIADGPVGRLAAWSKLSDEDVADIFSVDGDALTVGVASAKLPSSKADRQRALVLLLAAAHRVAFSSDSVPASSVNRLLEDYAALDQNVAKNVSAQSTLVTRRGKRGAWNYRVTQPGLERAADLVRQFAEGIEGADR